MIRAQQTMMGMLQAQRLERERAGRKLQRAASSCRNHTHRQQTLEQSESDCTGIQLHIKIHVHSSLSLNSSKEDPKGFGQRVKFFKVSVAICSLNPAPEAQELSYSDLNIP